MKSISAPYQFFTESDGSPLDDGKIYIGTENLNPETNPIQVWADLAGTIPLAQPLRTSSGYIVRYGTPVNVFVDSAHSITVKDRNGVLISNQQSSAVITPESGSGNIVDDFGAVPDNGLDQAAAFNAAFATSNSQIFIPAGTYTIDSLLVIDCENLEVYGVQGATIITTSTLVEIAQIVKMVNVNFYGITFQVLTASGLPSRGVIFADDAEITNSSFVRCKQTAPDCTAGGFIADGTSVIDGLDLDQNEVFDVGGKGIFFEATSYKNVNIKGGSVKNTALYTLENGDGVTFSVGGSQSNIDGVEISNTFGACIKLDSVSDIFVANNRFADLSRICNVIDSDNTSANNISITYFNNETVGRVFDGSVNIVSHENTQLSQNRWYLTGAFHLTDTTKLKASGDMIDSTFANAVLVDGTSSNNEWLGGIITNASAVDDAGNVTVLATGANVEVTRIVSVEIYKTAAGSLVDGTVGAEMPDLIYCYGDSTQVVDGEVTVWTPTVSFPDMTAVAYTAEGTYVKNGGCVSFICFIQFTNKGSGSAADGMTIEGFPTTQTSTLTQMRGGGTVVYENFTGITGMVQAQVLGDATPYMYLYECGGAGATAISRGSLTNTGYFYVSGQYFTDE
jgi:hypothetical protein